MTTTSLEFKAVSRETTGKQVKRLRLEGLVPAVLYGNDKKGRVLSVNAHDFHKLYKEAGSTTLINLGIDATAPVKVLIHDVQLNPTKRTISHVDFLEVNLKEKLRTEIPLAIVGQTDLVDVQDGTILTVRDNVEVECLPEDLVSEIEVDISVLKDFDDAIRVSDLKVPAGIEILTDADEMLISVSAPRSEAEMEELEAEPVAAPEAEATEGGEPAEGDAEAAEAKE